MDVTRYLPDRFGLTNHSELQKIFDKYEWPVLSDLWVPIAAAVLVGCAERLTINFLTKGTRKDYIKAQILGKGDDGFKERKAYHASQHIFKGCYFICSSIAETWILNKTTFFPWYFGAIN